MSGRRYRAGYWIGYYVLGPLVMLAVLAGVLAVIAWLVGR